MHEILIKENDVSFKGKTQWKREGKSVLKSYWSPV